MANQRLLIDIIANDKTKQALGGLQKGLARVKQSVFNLRNAFIGLGAGVVIKGFIDAGIQIENLEVQLNALFGSAREGKKALKEVTDFASGTPFELKNIQQGITALATIRKQAEANGVSFDELLKITGNTATVLGGDFALASLQIQRSFSAGISSAELFRERGVKAMAGFKEGVSINANESIKGLAKAFGTGGEFGNLIDDLSKTLFGTISNLKDAFFIFQVEVSKGFFEALKSNLGDLKKTVEENRKEIAEFGQMIGTGLSSVINATANTLKFFKDNIAIITEAFRIFIALKVVAFFHNLAVAIGVANASMIGFNATVKKNLLIGGAIVVLSNLDRIISKLKEVARMMGIIDPKALEIPDRNRGLIIATIKVGKIETLSEAIKRNFADVFTSFRDANKTALGEMQGKLTSIGTTIGQGLNKGIKSFSDALAQSVVLGKNLQETLQNLAQTIMVKLLSFAIELILRKQVELFIEKQITAEKIKQATIGTANALSGLGSLKGFFGMANGGAVRKGQPVVVGERGAEMFVPNSTGQITQSARGTGGGAVNVNFTINTIDSRGFDEALVENRGTISSIINNALAEKGRGELI
tara:strand:+ start:2990 stop:4756 length:1767 start_codon:yes stop_codon:yes gene_type:complete